ncbi:MAG: chloride channel protein, partial [Paraburkholderia terricola]
LIASRVARLFAPPLYESLAQRYMAPLPQPAPAPVPEVPEVDVPEPAAVDEVTGDAPAEDGAPRQ